MSSTSDNRKAQPADMSADINCDTYRMIVEDSLQGYLIIQDFRFVYANRAIAELTGFSREELLTFTTEQILELIHPADRELLLSIARDCPEGRPVPPRFQHRVLRKDGGIRWMEDSAKPVRIGGRPAVQVSYIDITERKEAEKALNDELTRRRILTEQSRDGIVVLNEDGSVYESNKRFRDMLGYTPEEMAGLSVWEWDCTVSHDQIKEMLATVDEKGQSFETRHRRKNGTIYDVSISSNGAVFDDKKLVFCVCRDITDLKKSQRRQRDENLVLTLLEQGAALQDILNAIVRLGESYNSNLRGSIRLYDSSRKRLIQTAAPSLPIAFNAALSNGIPVGMNKGSSGTAAYLRERVIVPDLAKSDLFKPDSETVRQAKVYGLLACWSQPVISSDGNLLGTITHYSTVKGEPDPDSLAVLEWSARIAALAIERKQTEEHVQHLYQKEKAVREELESEIQKRINFTRALIHELKTPLTPIIASISTLVDGISEEPWHSLAVNIDRGAARLEGRIDELLDIARGEAGMLTIETHSLRPLPFLREVVEELTLVAASRGQFLTLDVPASLPRIRADENRLRQVITNLVNNAFKYTGPETEIVIRARARKDLLLVEVQDYGQGMEPEERDRIFNLYYRGTSETQRRSGLGIGLALCKNIIEIHGGTIWVESEKGKGSTFGFTIPLDKRTPKKANLLA